MRPIPTLSEVLQDLARQQRKLKKELDQGALVLILVIILMLLANWIMNLLGW
jgi:hypothetical protein